jgi:hypothetical protein
MRDWVERMKSLGAAADGEGVIARLAPGEGALTECYELGKPPAGKARPNP